MKSKAQAWAELLGQAEQTTQRVEQMRPEKSREVYVAGVGWFHLEVSDSGHPLVVLHGKSSYEVWGKDSCGQLLELAHWLLNTFAPREPHIG